MDHSIDEMELIFRRPDAAAALAQDERERTVRGNDDLCVIAGERFFIRAVLPLPVETRKSPYNIGLWVEVEEATFDRVYELWSEPEQAKEPPFACSVANDVPTLPSTLGLSAQLCLTGPTTRPRVMLARSAHPLYREQADGIVPHRAHEYSSLFA